MQRSTISRIVLIAVSTVGSLGVVGCKDHDMGMDHDNMKTQTPMKQDMNGNNLPSDDTSSNTKMPPKTATTMPM